MFARRSDRVRRDGNRCPAERVTRGHQTRRLPHDLAPRPASPRPGRGRRDRAVEVHLSPAPRRRRRRARRLAREHEREPRGESARSGDNDRRHAAIRRRSEGRPGKAARTSSSSRPSSDPENGSAGTSVRTTWSRWSSPPCTRVSSTGSRTTREHSHTPRRSRPRLLSNSPVTPSARVPGRRMSSLPSATLLRHLRRTRSSSRSGATTMQGASSPWQRPTPPAGALPGYRCGCVVVADADRAPRQGAGAARCG